MTMAIPPRTTLGVIGVGEVGAATLYAAMIHGVAGRLLAWDINRPKLDAHVLDIAHGVPFCPPCRVETVDDPAAMAGCDAIIVTAGVKQHPGESRLALAEANARLVRELLPTLLRGSATSVIVIVTNPVDVMTQVALDVADELGADPRRIMGSGTVLDTARLRHELSLRLAVAPTSVHATIAGEHGDTSVALWSRAAVGGVPLREFVDARTGAQAIDAARELEIAARVRDAAQVIIRGKGATAQAIGLASTRIARSILNDECAALPVSTLHTAIAGRSIPPTCFSVPTIVGRRGVVRVLDEGTLDDAERDALLHSATTLRASYERVREVPVA